MFNAHRNEIELGESEWRLVVSLLHYLETKWAEPDEGIWEVRGGPRQFTHSKVMAWVAFDRAVKLIESCGCAADHDLPRWKHLRDQIHREVCERGYNSTVRSFTQSYGSEQLDASILMMPLVGFLPPDDERVRNTIAAVERELMTDGLVSRYKTDQSDVDGLPEGEGVFLPCSFWMVDCLHLVGRKKEARQLFERLLDLRNDVGLLSEEYDVKRKRLLGNFPQAFSHVGLVNSADILSEKPEAAARRRKG
jgi:GH15 family glucan-1,4-alpha-glucosidase